MFIDGKLAVGTVPQILEQLALLPSSFLNYVGSSGPEPLITTGDKEYETRIDLYYAAIDLQRQEQHEYAIEKLQDAEKIKETQPCSTLLAHISYAMGKSYEMLDKLDEAVKRFHNSIEQFFAVNQYFNVVDSYISIAEIYATQETLEEYIQEQHTILSQVQSENNHLGELKARLALGTAHRNQNNYNEFIEHYARAYSIQQGPVDLNAIRVEQHEVGFSNEEIIGSDSIIHCVVVIIHEPVSKKTALAHIDWRTNIASLTKDVISKFPNDHLLNTYLIGGGYRAGHNQQISDYNIEKVVKELKKHSFIDVKAADIGDKNSPPGVIFDPVTAKLTHAALGKEDEATALRKVLIDLSDDSDLYIAFDLTKTKNIPKPVLNEDQQQKIIEQCQLFLSWLEAGYGIDTLQANQIYSPLIKLAKEIISHNIQITANTSDSIYPQDLSNIEELLGDVCITNIEVN